MKQKHQNKKIILGIAIALLLIFSFPLNSFASGISKDGVVTLVNKERVGRGLNSLTANSKLEKAAQWKAEDMIEKDYWEHFHNGKSPWEWMKEAGYSYIDAGENLAIDFSELESMHTAWMNSPTHRDNIMNSKYKEIGIGVASGDFEGHQTIVVVQMFGNPTAQDSTVETPNVEATNTENPSQNNFEAKADQNLDSLPINQLEDNSKDNLLHKGIKTVKNLFYKIAFNYKSNWQRNIALIRSSIMHNYSAAANN